MKVLSEKICLYSGNNDMIERRETMVTKLEYLYRYQKL